jgi:DNA-binding XRE family transcriptional regulator
MTFAKVPVDARHPRANKLDDDTEDFEVREKIRTALKVRRRQVGMFAKTASLNAGRPKEWCGYLERPEKTSSFHWRFNDIHQWAEVLGVDLYMVPELNPVLPEDRIGPLARTGVTMSSMSAVGTLEYLRDWRVFHGIEQKDLGARLGVGHSTMWAIEESANPKISTVQRYCRGLGGRISFHMEKVDIPAFLFPA